MRLDQFTYVLWVCDQRTIAIAGYSVAKEGTTSIVPIFDNKMIWDDPPSFRPCLAVIRETESNFGEAGSICEPTC